MTFYVESSGAYTPLPGTNLDPSLAIFDMKMNKITYRITEQIMVVLTPASSTDAYFREC